MTEVQEVRSWTLKRPGFEDVTISVGQSFRRSSVPAGLQHVDRIVVIDAEKNLVAFVVTIIDEYVKTEVVDGRDVLDQVNMGEFEIVPNYENDIMNNPNFKID